MCLLTVKRLCNWSVPNKTGILAYRTHHELWNNTLVSMFNASVWLYLKPNAAESQRTCWMAGTWNQWGGRGNLLISICAYLKATLRIKLLANMLHWAVWSIERRKLAHLCLIISNSTEANRLTEKTTWLRDLFFFSFFQTLQMKPNYKEAIVLSFLGKQSWHLSYTYNTSHTKMSTRHSFFANFTHGFLFLSFFLM